MDNGDLNWAYFANGTIHIICSSHNDIAWFDTPADTMQWRDERSITPALERMAHNPDVHFSMENVLYLLEYLERHPERREEVRQRTMNGQIDWGATFNQPYESLLTGEQLVREIYFGRKLLKKLFPGTNPRVYYNPDVPSRALQMPQILAKADIPYLLISRHRPGLQWWASPDGSRVLVWSMGHYADSLFRKTLEGELPKVRSDIKRILDSWQDEYAQRKLPPHFAFLNSMDYIPPSDFDQLLSDWAEYAQSVESTGNGNQPPTLRYSTPEQFFDAIAAGEAELETLVGERPNVWLYIHGPCHYQAITAKRETGVLLPAAEIFHTINAILTDSWEHYPELELQQAWLESIYDDHGWGGKNGHITDEMFRKKLYSARSAAHKLLQEALHAIASQIKSAPAQGLPVVVFNDLAWSRTDPVICKIPRANGAFQLLTEDNQEIPYQVWTPGSGTYTEIAFIAENMPSVGYRAYRAVETTDRLDSKLPEGVQVTPTSYENQHFRVELGAGGIQQLYHKRLDADVFCTERYLGAELLMLESVGNDAHEFGFIQQPTTATDFEKTSNYQPAWKITASGSVFTRYTLSQHLRYCTLVQSLVFFHHLDRIDVEVDLLNWTGVKSREFRLAFPLNMAGAAITYEVPFGTVEVGRQETDGFITDQPVYPMGPVYAESGHTIHPREIQNFISANTEKLGFTLGSSVAVCDYIDPYHLRPASYPVIQPVLLASRRSCHSEGDWYLQAGDHHFQFSLYVHESGWQNGYRRGIQTNHPLMPIVAPKPIPSAGLAAEASFLTISDHNVLLSALKKCEDDQTIILRCYEMEGRQTTAQIQLPFPIQIVEQTNIIEEAGESAKSLDSHGQTFAVSLPPYAIETFKLTRG
ncbi:MAG: alpha-mannosidase [Anaerolineae bacterium]|nr:alpha-mannosidase [Anaerolineae bacterium]